MLHLILNSLAYALKDFFVKFWNAVEVFMLQCSRYYTYQQIIFGNIEEYSNIPDCEWNPNTNMRKGFFMIKRYHDIAACCHQKRSIIFNVTLSLAAKSTIYNKNHIYRSSRHRSQKFTFQMRFLYNEEKFYKVALWQKIGSCEINCTILASVVQDIKNIFFEAKKSKKIHYPVKHKRERRI